ncbi:MAG: cytidylate kinase-like family protein [Magnetococcales bacterium]|nr:cytidylate kinase-like family protein [Magnetococcales bacterium]
MAERDHYEIIQAILQTEFYQLRKQTNAQIPSPPVVTISRDHGANGRQIASLLADRLGVRHYDRELLEAITWQVQGDKRLMQRLDEKIVGVFDDFILSGFTKKGVLKDLFERSMVKVIIGIGQIGGVIVGRGAHLLIQPGRAFRLHVEGSLSQCARRVALEEGVSLEKAEKRVIKVNNQRIRFAKRIYKRHPHLKSYYDMVINSDLLLPGQVVHIVLLTMKLGGFPVPGGGGLVECGDSVLR